mgnify:FL=1
MSSRYNNRGKVFVTKRDMFKQLKSNRKIDSAQLVSTAKFNRITQADLEDLQYDPYIWSRGDRFYKLAADFYDQAGLWWVIALFNNAPTEQHLTLGEEIYIPRNPESIASLFGIV